MSKDDTDRDFQSASAVLITASEDSFGPFLECTVKRMGISDENALAKCLQEAAPDVVFLRTQFPDAEAQTLGIRLRLYRRTRSMSIITIAAVGDEQTQQDRLIFDDNEYVSRSPETLMTSIGTTLDGSNRSPIPSRQELLAFQDIELDLASHRVCRNGRTIHLAPTQFRLLEHLMRNPYRAYSRDELQNAAWPRAVHIGPRTIDVHIGNLRAALNRDSDRDLIRTVRSVGYALSERSDS
ncbi:winged helix-turn-helix transcriptional regulator [Rhizobium gallicum]|uniref:winged helix-turn-helix transcriptional regulator n=1 Tax=Rhizobium gallicum TaxID=56730 RepID=UPI001EF8E345|nr:winged-helix domain-containing protein [Rhizobium gallicum]ULJ74301.1 winged-helix domain-containing protein [Rhizobium gallicum]